LGIPDLDCRVVLHSAADSSASAREEVAGAAGVDQVRDEHAPSSPAAARSTPLSAPPSSTSTTAPASSTTSAAAAGAGGVSEAGGAGDVPAESSRCRRPAARGPRPRRDRQLGRKVRYWLADGSSRAAYEAVLREEDDVTEEAPGKRHRQPLLTSDKLQHAADHGWTMLGPRWLWRRVASYSRRVLDTLKLWGP
ncbi:Merozoite surface protein 1, partial [Frankliniella fusca]